MAESKSPFRKSLVDVGRQAMQYFVIGAYFAFWSYKSDLRDRWAKSTALGIVTLSSLILALELLTEMTGRRGLHKIVYLIITWIPESVRLFLLVVAAAYLIWHHFEEAKKPRYEYTFVRRLCEYLERRPDHDGDAAMANVLELFHSVFLSFGLGHVSLYILHGDRLTIDPRHVYPQESNSAFFVPLAVGEGVAGRVCQDMMIRYVPRLNFPFKKSRRFLPTMPFPHAVQMAYRMEGEVQHERSELGNEKPDLFIFKSGVADGANTVPLFTSFLSVPLKAADGTRCVGVLNFDFRRVDPLDKSDIAKAAVFGLVLGDEMARRAGSIPADLSSIK